MSSVSSDIIYVAKDCVDFHKLEIGAFYVNDESEGKNLIEEILRGSIQANPVTGNMVTEASDKEWRSFLNQVDTVEDVIRKEIEEEGKENLILADEQRAERRQYWQAQWEEFLANARLYYKEIPLEAESNHSLLIQEPRQNEEISDNKFVLDVTDRVELLVSNQDRKIEIPNKQSNIPYSEYIRDGAIVYNGVTFQYGEGLLSLGDVSNPSNVLTIPLAGGGTLLVNRDCIGMLGKAIGMFCAEDIGNILRAIAEDQKIHSMEYEMEEDENDTVNHLVEHGEETQEDKSDE